MPCGGWIVSGPLNWKLTSGLGDPEGEGDGEGDGAVLFIVKRLSDSSVVDPTGVCGAAAGIPSGPGTRS